MIKRFFSILFFFSFCNTVFSQNIAWNSIENDISKKKFLLSNKKRLTSIKTMMLANRDEIGFARSMHLIMLIDDLRTEDTLFFKNSFFIDSILAAKNTSPLLQSLMHILKAKRLFEFQKSISFSSRKKIVQPSEDMTDYRDIEQKQLDSIIFQEYESAKNISKKIPSPDVQQLIWLSSDPLLFLFKPDYTDIIFAEQLNFQTTSSPNLYYTITDTAFAAGLRENFLSEQNKKYFDLPRQKIFDTYLQWSRYHANEKEKAAFIETIAVRHFIKNYYERDDDSSYLHYLLRIVQSPYNTVKATGVYQLAFYWYRLGEQYSGQLKLNIYSSARKFFRFDSAYRPYHNQTLDLIEKNKSLLDSFSYLQKDLTRLREKIVEKSLGINADEIYLPGKNITFYADFKNITQLNFHIVKLNMKDRLQPDLRFKPDSVKIYEGQVMFDSIIYLPATNDHQNHAFEITIPALPIGAYAFTYSDSALPTEKNKTHFITFNVSNIAKINTDNKVFILDRTTGFPLTNARVVAISQHSDERFYTYSNPKKILADGSVYITESSVKGLYIVDRNDTLATSYSATETDLPEAIADKDDDEEDRGSYYEDNTQLCMYTDRGIYRPGQTVQFKGIVFTRNPKTGERVVANKKNIKALYFNLAMGADIDSANRKRFDSIPLYINDPFDKTVDTLRFALNDFGSFAGSYKIGSNAATGEWEFSSDIDVKYENRGRFSVEEYKRPTFEMSIEKPKNYLALGDSFSVKVKTRSFAGANLAGTKIRYTVNASFDLALLKDTSIILYQNKLIADTAAFTNNNGELQIKIPANFLAEYFIPHSISKTITYYINATAIDATGESHEEKTDIRLSNRPVIINILSEKIYERSQLQSIGIKARNVYSGNVNKSLTVKFYKKINPTLPPRSWIKTDYVFENGRWKYAPVNTSVYQKDRNQLIYSTSTMSGEGQVLIPDSMMESGDYTMNITCEENGKIIGESSNSFSVYNKTKNTFSENDDAFHHLSANWIEKDKSISWDFGNRNENIFSIYQAVYFIKTKKGIAVKSHYETTNTTAGISTWKFKAPENITGDNVIISHTYILNGETYSEKERVYNIVSEKESPQIFVEKYRIKIAPGSTQKFVVRIKTKNKNTVAELITTLYDASLDKITGHRWNELKDRIDYNISVDWDEKINGSNYDNLLPSPVAARQKVSASQPLWWLNAMDYSYLKDDGEDRMDQNLQSGLSGKVSGLYIQEGRSSLSDIVVVGYGRSKNSIAYASSTIYIRGVASMNELNIPLVILDGIVYEGDLSKINMNLLADIVVLKDATATALFGSKAAKGVLLLSTNGPVKIPQQEEPVIKARKNFSETAFFEPQVHADKDGFYNISFTVPESATEWNWKMMAHTKNAAFTYLEKKIVSQLPLMVQPNMPRFLYQGDEIKLQTRITNIDSVDLAGVSNCKIEDAVTGEDLTSKIISVSKQSFSVEKRSNQTVGYWLKIPEDLLHPLTIKVTAAANNFSDGEEYTIPVLAKKILAIKNVPFTISADTMLHAPSLPADATIYGVSLYIDPKPQGAVLNALPYMAFYPYDCAEQTFNKLLAFAVAKKIMITDTNAGKTILALKASPVKDVTTSLPEELDEHTMPWLQLDHANDLHQKQLQKLFDTLSTNQKSEELFEHLTGLQQSDGGFSWFKGGKSDFYISEYLLASFGEANKNKITVISNSFRFQKFSQMLESLTAYCDAQFMKTQIITTNDLLYIHARCLWANKFPLSPGIILKINASLNNFWKNPDDHLLSVQAELVQASLDYKSESQYRNLALQQLESIRQLAISDNINGVRWRDLSNKDDFSSTEEETIVLLANAFETTGHSEKEVKGITQWLLNTKNDHNWSSTKSTAAVVNLLQKNQLAVTGEPLTISTKIKDSVITVTDNLLSGSLTGFLESKELAQISLRKGGGSMASGGLNYYYFTENPPINIQENEVNIRKELSRFNKTNNTWEVITEQARLKIADKVKVTLTLNLPVQLKYVFIDEKRAAALDVEDNESGYRWASQFNYYASVRDAGHQFFAEQIPSGISTISYETIVAKEGTFYNGPVILQCMYQPQVKAYGRGMKIVVGNE